MSAASHDSGIEQGQSQRRCAVVLGALPHGELQSATSGQVDWNFVETPTVEAAEALLTHNPEVRVGVWVHTSAASTAPDFRKFVKLRARHAKVLWLAILPHGATQDDSIAAHVAQHCMDYLTIPVDQERLYSAVGHVEGMARLFERMASEPQVAVKDGQMVGTSQAMRDLLHIIRKVGRSDAPVFISGETGTGKELAARAIHEHSARKKGPFVAVDCGAIAPNLIQSELFGHEQGAFTGAVRRKIGLIEAAEGGTLFLDEIGDLPLDLQANLLRFLQESTIQRVGGTQSISINTRVIAATHVKLEEAIARCRFREDLFYRLNVLRIQVPPLRERGGDLELLARFFLTQFTKDTTKTLRGFTPEALARIRRHTWRGNMRELINRVRRATVMADGPWITPNDLDLPEEDTSSESDVFQLEQVRAIAERDAIQRALVVSGNNHSAAARTLGISRATFYRLVEKHRIFLTAAAPGQ
jgi:DNA-binding NtrC family response regulator